MKDFKDMTQEELREFLKVVNKLADEIQMKDERIPAAGTVVADTNPDLVDAERQAKAFADARRKGKTYRSDFGATDEDRSIAAGVKNWLVNKGKRLRGNVKK